MKKILLSIFMLVVSQSVYAITQFSNLRTVAYSEEQELFTYDLSDVVATELSTGVEFVDPVYRVVNGYNPDMTGQLYFNSIGNYFGYQSVPGSANSSEIFNVLLYMKEGACEFCSPDRSTLWLDYTMNVLSFSSLIQLLDVPTFDMTAYNGFVNFGIPSYDRETMERVAREDLMYVNVVSSGVYAPTQGTVVPHMSGYIDTFTYLANPGAAGWDRILVFTRHKNGKMGYNFFYIYNP